ncbi:hypothetical protein [Sphingomonas sp. Leaf4]|uniref:hypothetical protein n=1 Tax=Sphingomonas sp. Leaf4 TaxID=2876553 RepID=UPI001E4C51C1|nr:hypothetical protein [Sphingomonas sp. Leaf4]
MRATVSILALIFVAGCSNPARDDGTTTADDATTVDSAPGVDVTAAPGVAFQYHYGFRLPAERIAAVQEAHAAACERLGVNRCRITAMRYSRDADNDVDARLGFLLAPELARAFGRDGIRAVEAAEGMVLDAQITGEDAGAKIGQLTRTRDAATADTRTIDARSIGTGREARAELERQRASATDAARTAQAAIAEQRASLAATPVVFDYRAGQAIRSFDPASPLTHAADLAVTSARWTLGTVLAALGVGLPPLAVALLGLWLWARGRRLWERRMAHGA